MPRYIITFGQIHVHRLQGHTLDKDCVAEIEGRTMQEAHDKAMFMFKGVFRQCIEESIFDRSGDIKYFPRGKIRITL